MDTKSNDDSAGSDSLDKSMQQKCVMTVDSAATSPQQQELHGEQKTDATDATSSVGDCSAAVTQISQNLKETTLAETAASASNEDSDTKGAGDSSPSTDDITSEAQSSDRPPKKVRFHQDVKANDGGNRVTKKRRSAHGTGARGASGLGATARCDEMDLDEYCDDGDEDDDNEEEEQEEETEEEFDLAKTIAEAEDYLKQHPLTFVQRIEQNGEVRDGLLNIEDIVEDILDDNDADFYKRAKPENGIERVLGKETKAGKVEFLLRYENEGGLFWESEEYIRRMCPSLLKAYEKTRERRQQRLMHHVAKRQSLRQRYTDF